jgi:hypothetical protein
MTIIPSEHIIPEKTSGPQVIELSSKMNSNAPLFSLVGATLKRMLPSSFERI